MAITSVLTSSPASCALFLNRNGEVLVHGKHLSSSTLLSSAKRCGSRRGIKAFLFKLEDEPILKEALKEPVAFMGGMFAGLLRLDLKEDPLKEWVTRTVEASGIIEQEANAEDAEPEDIPQQIEIE